MARARTASTHSRAATIQGMARSVAHPAYSKIIAAEGELQAAQKLSEAAKIMSENPISLQLRYLQTIREMSHEKSIHTLIPLPMDLISCFLKKPEVQEKK